MNSVLGSQFEASLRILILLEAAKNLVLTEGAIAALDNIIIYSHDFGLSETNLHGNSRYRYGEFASRRITIRAAIKKLVLDGLVLVTRSSSGFQYKLSDDGIDFASSLDTAYADHYFASATKVIARGKAYGDDGKAFEGHHMKSAEKFPEYQGEPANIQFLSRSEHFAAHDGNFQNSTNGCFKPYTGETIDFGLKKYEPCEIYKLSEPVTIAGCQAQDTTENSDVSSDTGTDKSTVKASTTTRLNPPEKSGFGSAVKLLTDKVAKFYIRHKSIIDPVAAFVATTAAVVIKETLSGSSKSNSSEYENDGDYNYSTYSSPPVASGGGTDSFQHEDTIGHSSPNEHAVSAHRQRYNGEWRDKAPYTRGKNSDE